MSMNLDRLEREQVIVDQCDEIARLKAELAASQRESGLEHNHSCDLSINLERLKAENQTLQDERAASFAMLAKAIGGVGMTEYQAEVDLEIESRIKQLKADHQAIGNLLATLNGDGGQRQDEVGIKQAAEEGLARVLQMMQVMAEKGIELPKPHSRRKA